MRTLVISNASRSLLNGSIIHRAVAVRRQLADGSWEVLVDDDMGFALDCLSGDVDRAIKLVCAGGRAAGWWHLCERCGSELDDDWCWTCRRLVL